MRTLFIWHRIGVSKWRTLMNRIMTFRFHRTFLDQLSDYQLLRNDSPLSSQCKEKRNVYGDDIQMFSLYRLNRQSSNTPAFSNYISNGDPGLRKRRAHFSTSTYDINGQEPNPALEDCAILESQCTPRHSSAQRRLATSRNLSSESRLQE